MAQVKADMELLTAQARELGATTMFTAKQAADAMGYLGMAVWKTMPVPKQGYLKIRKTNTP